MKVQSDNDFVTRKVLKEELKAELDVVKKDINDTFDDLFERLDTANREYRDQILTQISNFVGRIDNLKSENTVSSNQYNRLKVRMNDHDKRIRKLEKASN